MILFFNCKEIGKKLNIYKLIIRSVLAMRIVRAGLEASEDFKTATCDVAHKLMTDAVEEEIKLTQNSSKETVEVDDSNQEAIRRLSIENLEQGDISENESELTNTPDTVVDLIKDQLRMKEAEKQAEMNIPTADNEYSSWRIQRSNKY
ncbi:hypothetical protein TSAR_008229 [Trichomalopsis sarcophagae]|uniref:Uncharacterized protein n=1 Tax=Trichomalopsis sarcophagae TaxID=543379 RepID=A0A232FMH1_9HYME|nr:hypothetical protein TSAR_008229 [Trichomalopsis sarcophagae]